MVTDAFGEQRGRKQEQSLGVGAPLGRQTGCCRGCEKALGHPLAESGLLLKSRPHLEGRARVPPQ